MIRRVLLCVGMLFMVSTHGVLGQSQGTLLDIVISGNSRLTDDAVITYTGLQRGDEFNSETAADVLKKLYETELFDDIRVTIDAEVLVIQLRENPVIRRVAFVGQDDVDEEDLRDAVALKPRDVYNKTRIQRAVKRLLDLYRSQGYYAATVSPKRINLAQNRVDLEFVIDEGKAATIESINFIGNERFSDDRLKEVIFNREARWYLFFASNDVYDPERVRYDQELLRRFYREEGYLDFRVISATAELTPDQNEFIITFVVQEGERYEIESITFENNLPELKGVDFSEDFSHRAGNWFRESDIEDTIARMVDHAREAGYGFVEIDPLTERLPEDNKVKIVYNINESGRFFVSRINIKGNNRTVEEVIRREILISEGDALNAELARRSRQRLQVLGIFSDVSIASRLTDVPDREVIDIEVKEARTGEFSISAGYSSNDGFLSNAQISERNFLGRNQKLNFGFTYSDRRISYDIGFTEPYFMGKNISLGSNVYYTTYDYQAESGYKRRLIGGNIVSGYRLLGDVRQSWAYIFENSKIFDITTRSQSILDSAGGRNKSSIKQTLSIDQRDSFRKPTQGYNSSASVELAGIGGNVRFTRFTGTLGLYQNFTPEWVTGINVRFGHIVAYGGEIVEVQDRFYLGGDDLRGFDFYGVGPRNIVQRDSLGGNTFYTVQIEQSFPLGLPEAVGMEGRIFFDLGSLHQVDNASIVVFDDHFLRTSVGLGIAWDSPLGPLRLYYAFPLKKYYLDETRRFIFTVGTNF